MTQQLLLVDFENVQQLDFAHLADSFQIHIFVGAGQKNIPVDLVIKAHSLGDRLHWHQINSAGVNALDFFIAYQLGRMVEQSSKLVCVILSKDKGFDPLVRHLNQNNIACQRVNCLSELAPAAAKPPKKSTTPTSPHYARVVESLKKSPKQARPSKRVSLSNHIKNILQQQPSQAEVEAIVKLLFVNKLVSETNGKLVYTL